MNSATDIANGIACGLGCNLFPSGSIAQLVPGQEGTAAASFVKSQQRRLLCGSSSCPELGFADQSSFTVGCWARPTLETNADLLFRGRFTNVTVAKGYRMARASVGGNVFLRCMIGDGVLMSATGTVATSLVGTFPASVWTHVACRFDSSQSPPPPAPPDRRWQAFINGGASGAVKNTGAVHDISSEFSLGANQFNPSLAYEGALDECFATAAPLSDTALCRIARCGIRGEHCRCDAANPALYAVGGRGLERCVASKCDSGAKLNAACTTDEDCRCSLAGVACNALGP